MSFLKEVGFIDAVQVPSNDGEDLLCYVVTNTCYAALVSTCRVSPGVKIMDIRDRSMPIEHMTTYEKCCVFQHMTGNSCVDDGLLSRMGRLTFIGGQKLGACLMIANQWHPHSTTNCHFVCWKSIPI